MSDLHTTFRIAREAQACPDGYAAMAKALGGVHTYGEDRPIPLTRVLEVCGLEDALWCLWHVLPAETQMRDKFARLLACDYAEHVAHLWVAPPGVAWEPLETITVARRYAMGQATRVELLAAWAAAGAAAGAAAWAAAGAAGAAGAAAGAAVEDAKEWQLQRFKKMLEAEKDA